MVTTRNNTSYGYSSSQQGRAGRAGGVLPGTVPRKKQRRSVRCAGGELPPGNSDSGSGSEGGSEGEGPPERARLTRNTAVTCLSFGKSRRVLYPRHFFCQRCDLWEQDRALVRKSANRCSKVYRCEASHTSCLFPTHLKEVYIPSRNLGRQCHQENSCDSSNSSNSDSSSSSSNSDSSSSSSRSNTSQRAAPQPQTHTKAEVAKLTWKIHKLDRENKALKQKLLRCSIQDDEQEHYDLELSIKEHIDALVLSHKNGHDQKLHKNGHNDKLVAKAISNAASAAVDGIAEQFMLAKAKRHIRKEIFSPWRIARLMDLHGGCLNLAAVELLRTLETNGKKYKRTIIPSSSEIKRVFARVERVGNVVVPFVMGSEGAETVRFNYDKVLTHIIATHGLANIGKERPLRMAQSVDGARLTTRISHVMGGLKIHDHATFCPIKKEFLMTGESARAQSRDLCFPMHLMLGKETCETLRGEFKPMFTFFENARKNGLEGLPDLKPLTITTEVDMSAAWKGLGRGGGAKVHNYPCHCCGIHSDELHHPKTNRCDRWCQGLHQDKPAGWRCYHNDIVTDEALISMEAEMTELLEGLENNLQDVDATSQLNLEEDPMSHDGRDAAMLNPQSIHYEPEETVDKRAFSQLVNDELQLRGLSTAGNLTTRRELLKEGLAKEWRLRQLMTELKTNKRPETALFLLMQVIPCILHMEMRVGLKVLTMIILEGIAESKAGNLFPELNTPNQRVKAYINSIEMTMNDRVLGDETDSSTWQCPFDHKEQKLGTISLENVKVRKVLSKIELFIEISVFKQDRKLKWLQCVPKYMTAIEIVRQKHNFSDQDIGNFQKNIDEWFQDWIYLTGAGGMTNYIHMLGSGHISEYMYKWRNLYEHSQQGWEAFNALLLKTFFFRNLVP